MHRYRLGLFLAVLLVSSPAIAEEALPSWEVGLGVGVGNFPDYRGADESSTYILPTPYFVIRSGPIRADRRGVRGSIFDKGRVSLNVTGNLGPPARSEKNETRQGMPDLDFAFEIGPSLNVRLYENETFDRLVTLRLPARAVLATDFRHIEHIGWVFLPNIAMDFIGTGPGRRWNFGMSAGPIFGSNEYHDYYYAVAPEYATPTRPVYDARSGYSGVGVALTLSKRYPKYWIGMFLRYDSLSGAVFDDSPLVRSTNYLAGGIVVSRILASSRSDVDTREAEQE